MTDGRGRYHRGMRRSTRRAFLAYILGAPLTAKKGETFPSEWRRYPDPTTEFWVFRLTDPAYTSTLPAWYQPCIARRGNFLLYGCDRSDGFQAYRMDLKNGGLRRLTEARTLDPSSLALAPNEHSFYCFDGDALCAVTISSLHVRQIYRVPVGWTRCPGMSLSGDGGFVLFGERQGERSRLRMVTVRGSARTIVEQPWILSDPLARPRRAQVLYRQDQGALWIGNSDGRQHRRLKLADGRIGPAAWAPDGRTILYLNFPSATGQLNTIREHTPDQNLDALVAKTSQFAHFDFNRNASVFVGSSRNAASPTILLLLRVNRREFTLCEHKASDAASVAPIFSPDSRRVLFNSDRHGKRAIYLISVDKLVEETD